MAKKRSKASSYKKPSSYRKTPVSEPENLPMIDSTQANSIQANSIQANSEKSKKTPPPKKSTYTSVLCKSIKSTNESHTQCLFQAMPGKKYCILHSSYCTTTDYVNSSKMIVTDNQPNNIIVEEVNPILSTIILHSGTNAHNSSPETESIKSRSIALPILKEQQNKTVSDIYQTNENDLEVKLLIMINDDECLEKIIRLIGPVFNDITLSEDQEDPWTMDIIWTQNNGVRTATDINKYYLFSYFDSDKKIRCLTVFTLHTMVVKDDFTHPLTMETIPKKDIIRAKELIDMYTVKLNLFKGQVDSVLSPEYNLKNKISKLFKRFHRNSIYFEEDWLININDEDKLLKIIRETDRLVKNNIQSINSSIKNLDLFADLPKKNINKEKLTDTEKLSDLIILKECICDNWEKMVKLADSELNQLPIWIIAHSLSPFVPEIKNKFENLELMLQ